MMGNKFIIETRISAGFDEYTPSYSNKSMSSLSLLIIRGAQYGFQYSFERGSDFLPLEVMKQGVVRRSRSNSEIAFYASYKNTMGEVCFQREEHGGLLIVMRSVDSETSLQVLMDLLLKMIELFEVCEFYARLA